MANRLDDIMEALVKRTITLESTVEDMRISSNPGVFTAVQTVSALTNVTGKDGTIFVSSSLGAYTINLPTAVGIGGRIYIVVDNDGNALVNNITINANGAENINGIGSYTINTNYGRLGIQSNGIDVIGFVD